MTKHELAAIEARVTAIRTALSVEVDEAVSESARDVPALIAEVRRLRAEVGVAYGHDYAKANLTYTGPCPLCQRGYA